MENRLLGLTTGFLGIIIWILGSFQSKYYLGYGMAGGFLLGYYSSQDRGLKKWIIYVKYLDISLDVIWDLCLSVRDVDLYMVKIVRILRGWRNDN